MIDQEREEHNRREQLRFIEDASEDGLHVSLYISTLDDSPVQSREGLAWGVLHLPASFVTSFDAGKSLFIEGRDLVLPLSHVFALQTGRGNHKRTLVVLDTPAQYSAAADMFNHPDVREIVGQTGLPLQMPHPKHQGGVLPALRRAVLRCLPGGAA